MAEQELTMLTDDYLGAAQLAFFRMKLESMHAEIVAHAQQAADELRGELATYPDPVDRATVEEEHNLEQCTRERAQKLLRLVAEAISRIDSGDYGWCEETGEPIGVARLMASPTASLTVEAQHRREARHRMFRA